LSIVSCHFASYDLRHAWKKANRLDRFTHYVPGVHRTPDPTNAPTPTGPGAPAAHSAQAMGKHPSREDFGLVQKAAMEAPPRQPRMTGAQGTRAIGGHRSYRPPSSHAAETPAPSALHVCVRHAPTTLSVCITYPAGTPLASPPPDTGGQFTLMRNAAERLLQEAGAGREHILSCEVFARGPFTSAALGALLHPWSVRPRITRQPPPTAPQAVMYLALVATRPAAL